MIAAIAGVALIAWPDKGLRTVGVFVGIWVLVFGGLHIVGALSNRQVPNWWVMLVVGVIEVPIGIWAMRRPGLTVALLVTLMGAWAVVTGIYQVLMAAELRKLASSHTSPSGRS